MGRCTSPSVKEGLCHLVVLPFSSLAPAPSLFLMLVSSSISALLRHRHRHPPSSDVRFLLICRWFLPFSVVGALRRCSCCRRPPPFNYHAQTIPRPRGRPQDRLQCQPCRIAVGGAGGAKMIGAKMDGAATIGGAMMHGAGVGKVGQVGQLGKIGAGVAPPQQRRRVPALVQPVFPRGPNLMRS